MKTILIILSVIGLGLTIIPSIMVYLQEMTMQTNHQLMFIGTILWFSTSPFWIKKQEL